MSAIDLDAQGIMNRVPIRPRHAVADIGAGEGRLAIPMAKFLRDGEVVALDVDADKLAVLGASARELNITNIREVLVQAGETLPIVDDGVDGVMLSMTLHHVDDPAFVLNEARRIIRPNGWLAVLELIKREDVEGHPMEQRIDEADALAMIADAGFRPLDSLDLDGRHYLIAAETQRRRTNQDGQEGAPPC